LGTLDPWSMKQKPLRKRLFWTLEGKTMIGGAAAVHYTSEAERHGTEDLLGVNHGKVIPLGIAPATHERNGRQERYVLVLSRLHPKKGLETLIDAFISITDQKFQSWRLVIAGDGERNYVSTLKQRAAPAQDRITFTGWL